MFQLCPRKSRLILRATGRTLQKILNPTNRDNWDDEEKGNKAHTLFPREIADGATLAATHLFSRSL